MSYHVICHVPPIKPKKKKAKIHARREKKTRKMKQLHTLYVDL